MPERPAPGARRRPADRRREILAVATALADERGIGNVTLADLARAVGVTTPALYRHIGSKEGLTAAVAAAVLDEIADALAAPEARASPRSLVATLLDVAGRDPGQLGAYLAIDPSYLDALSPHLGEARAAEARVLAPLAPLTEVEHRVLRVRLRAALAAVHALIVRDGAEAPSARKVTVERLAALLAGPALPARPDNGPAGRPTAHGPPERHVLAPPPRTALLHTAMRLFRQRGYHGVGVDEIGVQAGVSGPTLYRHFSCKADLLIEASDRSTIAVLDALEQVLRSAADVGSAAEAMAEAYARIAVGNIDLIVVTAREGGSIPHEARRLHQQRRRSVTDSWAELIAPSHEELPRRAVEGLVAAGMAAARSAAVAGSTDVTAPAASVVAEAARAIRILTVA